MSFKDYLFWTEAESLDEAILNIGNKSRSYPKSGQILILAGGAGSGKSFVNNAFISFEGKYFNVDDLKTKLLKYKPEKLVKKFEDYTGRYIESIKMEDPGDVALMHMFFKNNSIDIKEKEVFFRAAKDAKEKPNVIFDVTLKDTYALAEIAEYARFGGYDPKNIHIVWVLNDVQIAFKQNQERTRSVPEHIFFNTHSGASLTMKELLNHTENYRKYADGEIWILPNKARQDNDLVMRKGGGKFTPDKGSTIQYVKFYTAIKVKSIGQPALSQDKIEKEIFTKIQSYVPQNSKW